MEFGDLIKLPKVEATNQEEEARFSFFQGGYVEDFDNQGTFYSFLASKQHEIAAFLRNTSYQLPSISHNP